MGTILAGGLPDAKDDTFGNPESTLYRNPYKHIREHGIYFSDLSAVFGLPLVWLWMWNSEAMRYRSTPKHIYRNTHRSTYWKTYKHFYIYIVRCILTLAKHIWGIEYTLLIYLPFQNLFPSGRVHHSRVPLGAFRHHVFGNIVLMPQGLPNSFLKPNQSWCDTSGGVRADRHNFLSSSYQQSVVTQCFGILMYMRVVYINCMCRMHVPQQITLS